MNYLKYLMLVLLVSVMIVACTDDEMFEAETEQIIDSQGQADLLLEAQNTFKLKSESQEVSFNSSSGGNVCFFDNEPDWSRSVISDYYGQEILLVPTIELGSLPIGSEARWVFWDENEEVQLNLIVTQANPNLILKDENWNTNEFDGIIATFAEDGILAESFYRSPQESYEIWLSDIIEERGGDPCYGGSGWDNFWSGLFRGIGNVFSSIFGGSREGDVKDPTDWVKDSGFGNEGGLYRGGKLIFDARGNRLPPSGSIPSSPWELLPEGFFSKIRDFQTLFTDDCSSNENSFVNYLMHVGPINAKDFITHLLVDNVINNATVLPIGDYDQSQFSPSNYNLISEEIRFNLAPLLMLHIFSVSDPTDCNRSISDVINQLRQQVPRETLEAINIQRNCVLEGGVEFVEAVNEYRSYENWNEIVDIALLQLHENGNCGNLDLFNEIVFENVANHYSNESHPVESAGFHDRTLSCESFVFRAQLDGNGQVAAVDNLYLSKNYGGAYASTSLFCGHFTLPAERHTGEIISSGRAQDCAAWSANAAAAAAGFAFAENPAMHDEILIKIFITSFKVSMSRSSCGYGVMTKCHNADDVVGPNNAVWNNGFYDWLEEQFFGCN